MYQKGLAELPGNPQLELGLAKNYQRTNKNKEAINLYEKLHKKYPGNDEVANNLAGLLIGSGADSEGLTRALSLTGRFRDSSDPYFLDTYGWVLFKAGDTEASVVVLKKVVSIEPNNAIFRYHLGEAYFVSGDKENSKVELKKTIYLAKKQGEFEGIEKAKQLLSQIGR